MILDNENGLLLMRHDGLEERTWRSDTCYKLIFSYFGRGAYQTHSGDLSIEKDEFFIFNPEIDHKQLSVTQEKFLVEIQPSLLREAAERMGIKQAEPEFALISYKHPQVRQWVSFIRDFLSIHELSGSISGQFFLDNSLTQLSILMLQFGPGSHMNTFPAVKCEANINLVLTALRESYNEDWTLDQMAMVARMNKYQFAHMFKSELGVSPYSWLQLYRLFRSQYSLLNTHESILSIALQHGFKSVSSYNQLFKKVYRKTPGEFRRFNGLKK
ncbi:AraC-type DNA-binding protein [Thalassobacillus cyri]|uniref:AraC-type DNA-binding protein n=1 Tax=Thalassobacillus cyri TaxID=571932 RepID=A0A1H3ZFC5_9BACI|nr:helix-turn-helix domain-containing protein [Thalassobacillus cyri]SEA22479.1 AraC-type DNA-binding protein [Thalassobacillus cyri]